MTGAGLNIWALATDGNRDLCLRTKLDYFREHFVGSSMAADWQPPPLTILGKSKRLRDFVSWMLCAPVISERAADSLEPVISSHVEFLPLIELRRKRYFAVNVLSMVDCLDREKSDIQYSSTGADRMVSVHRAFFLSRQAVKVPIFKLPYWPAQVFVTRPFVDVVIANGLRGAAFGDPGANPFVPILRGRSVNVVPGIPE